MYVVSLTSEASLTSRTQSPNAHFVFLGPCPVILDLFAPRGVYLRLPLCIFYSGYMEFPGCTSCAVLGWTCLACCHPKRKLERSLQPLKLIPIRPVRDEHIPVLTELLRGWDRKNEGCSTTVRFANPARVFRCGMGVGEGWGLGWSQPTDQNETSRSGC